MALLTFDTLRNVPALAPWRSLMEQQHTVLVEGLWDAPKALLIALAQQTSGKQVVVLTGASREESRLFHDFPAFTDNPIVEFPAWETLPNEKIPPSPDVVGERYQVLEQLLSSNQKHIILSDLHACLQKLIDPQHFASLHLSISKGETFPFEKLIDRLISMGYTRRPIASDKGEFAVRGGIIDVFPVALPDAYRLEFWGDDIESIRLYDPVGQKSIKPIAGLSLTPAKELEFLTDGTPLCTLLEYLGDDAIIVFDDLLMLEDRYASMAEAWRTPSRTFCSIEDFLQSIEPLQKIYFSEHSAEDLGNVTIESAPQSLYSRSTPVHALSFEMFGRSLSTQRWNHSFQSISDSLLPQQPEGISGDDLLVALSYLGDNSDIELSIICNSDLEEQNLRSKLTNEGVNLPQKSKFLHGYLSSGFVITDDITKIVLPTTEFTHRYKMRRQKLRSTYHTPPSEIYELSPGETVVHINNGIGTFLGMERRPNNNNVETEFFLLEYANNAKLFVPIDQANQISKYIGAKDETPKLHTLGSSRWKKTRDNTQRAIIGYASELLESYAKRSIKGGFSCGDDSEELKIFEDEFPFIETEDQVHAILNVKEDMKSEKAMDRLICGDVGYGKTEVAMRAAFKAVNDGGKQVAILVPTTVLAIQHYDNFIERFSNFPINIAVLSRMRSSKQTHETLQELAQGTVDIVIGTHRLVSGDVVFKDLGLVIIDEEQRFGVKAKEHLKKVKTGIDCLTLSATPIPRTLYMAMMGARDMSVINTPPQDRLPITTVIAEPNDHTIKNAILRELARDGQVFFVHNRVESIYDAATAIKKLLPQARIVVGHGQMSSDEIDAVFHQFKQGKADILVATTIIENGLDIPNANTIIIDRADHFGLADLYQLRGRVGRWNRKAYAYLLVPKRRASDQIVRQRIGALAEVSTGYGGGMKIAMRDLEIRGAGDILGTEQSGHVSAIGFHLYCKMLKRTIDTLQGKIPVTLIDTKVDFPFDARLPDNYVNEPSLRMEIYHRLGEALTFEDIDDIWKEIKDRFGKPPMPVRWLYHMTRIRVYASQHYITSLKLDNTTLSIEYKQEKEIIPFSKPETPQDLESKVFKALKKMIAKRPSSS